MAGMLLRLTVFFSFTSETEKYVDMAKKIIDERNHAWERDKSAVVSCKTFKDMPSQYHPSGNQAAINDAFFGKFEIFCGFMGTRFGTPTKDFGSGAEEEYRLAVKRFDEGLSPHQIMFGFSSVPVDPSKIDPDQLKKVLEFKTSISSKQMYYTWDSDPAFKKSFSRQIDDVVTRLADDPEFRIKGGLSYL